MQVFKKLDANSILSLSGFAPKLAACTQIFIEDLLNVLWTYL